MLESVQRRATKFILNYPLHISYKERLTKLSILPLEYRRDMKDLLSLFKCTLGFYDIELSNYMKTLPAPKYSFRHDINNFTEFKCKTQYFKNSYFPRVSTRWNSLDKELIASDNIFSFKSKLKQMFRGRLMEYKLPHK